MRAGGDYRPSDPRPAVLGRAEVAGDRVVRGTSWRGSEGPEARVGSRVLGAARKDETIRCGCKSALYVERDTGAIRFVLYVDVSAVAETAHRQIRQKIMTVCRLIWLYGLTLGLKLVMGLILYLDLPWI